MRVAEVRAQARSEKYIIAANSPALVRKICWEIGRTKTAAVRPQSDSVRVNAQERTWIYRITFYFAAYIHDDRKYPSAM